MRLGTLVSVRCPREGEVLQPGDVVLRRVGGDADVGRVLEFIETERPSAFRWDDILVVRVTAPNKLIPSFLRYLLEYVHLAGYYRTVAKGTLRRKCIRTSDVAKLPVQEETP